jgi:DNA-3-methyladenine glycosylase
LPALLNGPVAEVARALLGWRLRSVIEDVPTEVVVIEVEAYGGSDDPASHAFHGPTIRNASMFMEAGTLYVYRSYGVHWCANVVTGPVGDGRAVLVRGGRPTAGIATIEQRRGRRDHLADGPGKLCEALGITGVHDGSSLSDGAIRLLPPHPEVGGRIEVSARVGITKATDRLWRFTLVQI